MKILVVVGFLILCLSPMIITSSRLAFDPDWHGSPAVARCPGCNCRIWEWQSYERRSSTPTEFSDNGLSVSAGMSCLYHCGCPTDESMKVSVTID
jgi:hypothetical protein